jgi:hypothetical protein
MQRTHQERERERERERESKRERESASLDPETFFLSMSRISLSFQPSQ